MRFWLQVIVKVSSDHLDRCGKKASDQYASMHNLLAAKIAPDACNNTAGLSPLSGQIVGYDNVDLFTIDP